MAAPMARAESAATDSAASAARAARARRAAARLRHGRLEPALDARQRQVLQARADDAAREAREHLGRQLDLRLAAREAREEQLRRRGLAQVLRAARVVERARRGVLLRAQQQVAGPEQLLRGGARPGEAAPGVVGRHARGPGAEVAVLLLDVHAERALELCRRARLLQLQRGVVRVLREHCRDVRRQPQALSLGQRGPRRGQQLIPHVLRHVQREGQEAVQRRREAVEQRARARRARAITRALSTRDHRQQAALRRRRRAADPRPREDGSKRRAGRRRGRLGRAHCLHEQTCDGVERGVGNEVRVPLAAEHVLQRRER